MTGGQDAARAPERMLTGPTAEAGGEASAWPEATALDTCGSPLNKREGR